MMPSGNTKCNAAEAEPEPASRHVACARHEIECHVEVLAVPEKHWANTAAWEHKNGIQTDKMRKILNSFLSLVTKYLVGRQQPVVREASKHMVGHATFWPG